MVFLHEYQWLFFRLENHEQEGNKQYSVLKHMQANASSRSRRAEQWRNP